MKVAVLGGSFDPPHLGHLTVAQQILKLLSFDQVWLMPCYSHAFDKRLSPSSRRYSMCQLLEEKNKILAHDFEIKKKGISYTYQTLQELKQKYPQHDFSWILGSDQLTLFTKWYHWQELLKEKLIVYPRSDNKEGIKKQLLELVNQDQLPENIIFLDQVGPINISSTLVRERIKKGLSIIDLVPQEVSQLIYDSTN